MITRPFCRALIIMACLGGLQACGQSGDLYLPGEGPPSQLPPTNGTTRPSPTPEPTPRPEATP